MKFGLKMLFHRVWQLLRDLSGENDYARYRDWTLARGQSPMTPKDFYLAQLRQKYSRPNRCC